MKHTLFQRQFKLPDLGTGMLSKVLNFLVELEGFVPLVKYPHILIDFSERQKECD